ncbi:uncharacterized protein LOC128652488 isoform X2 [Bombina bombina]|uniref:uncharacterized protein LOC128652488 isoform X2 n=1 Tax=Bombina bombina TaxID=8345 RepID=UPI00235A95C1|nr:uncharacterized protein LOC128652488 isoform X2 [Bombina bombina]
MNVFYFNWLSELISELSTHYVQLPAHQLLPTGIFPGIPAAQSGPDSCRHSRNNSMGYSKSCYRDDLSLWATIKVWLSWNFSWNSDSCEDYYKALIVDPFWEVTPLMAISSAIGRIIIHPMEQLSHIVGRSLRNVMKEIPSQWQPLVFLLVPLVCITMLAVAYFRRKHTTIVQCQRNEIPRSRRKAKGVVQLRG